MVAEHTIWPSGSAKTFVSVDLIAGTFSRLSLLNGVGACSCSESLFSAQSQELAPEQQSQDTRWVWHGLVEAALADNWASWKTSPSIMVIAILKFMTRVR